MKNQGTAILVLTALAACSPGSEKRDQQRQHSRLSADEIQAPYRDASQPIETRIDDLLSRMSLDDKMGQMIQAEIGFIKPEDLGALRLSSVLSGGDDVPDPATATAWADLYDSYQRAALATPLGIPMLFGIDAVHGHNYVYGASIFPHNIGLGSTRDQDLVERIGLATAEEIAATGMDWTFAPCVAVTRNDRWGRVYESFGEVPELPSTMTSLITGLQGAQLGGPLSVMATAKHYVGDGGTDNGKDAGETTVSEAELRAIHLPPFQEAVRRGVASIMVSYSSWNGAKMHNHQYLVNDVLKTELKFSGFVISDWNGIELLDGDYGFSAFDVRSAINAGVDMLMITEQYRNVLSILRDEIDAGRVPMARIDDANRRILRKKFEMGLFERPYTDRSLLNKVGSPEHRALAREAVQKSLVVLKNENQVLPIARNTPKIFVAGKTGDNIGFQSGGWTIQWQGLDGPITPGTSILQGIRQTVSPQTTLTFHEKGEGIDSSYAVAIAVIGEKPYAEYEGDRSDDLRLDAEDLSVLAKLKASGVPVVVVLVSGRPLDIHRELGDWAAFVAAWLPGTEGQGVADILFGLVAPTGKLPLTWMQTAAQEPINVGDGKVPLFPFGFGLSYPAM